MTHRERFRAVLEGKTPDRLPWVPRLDIWYSYHQRNNSLPEKYAGMTLDEVRKRLNAGKAARDGIVYVKTIDGFEVREERIGYDLTRYLVTPVGTVREKFSVNPEFPEGDPMRTEHYIKSVEDYRIMEFAVRNTHWEPAYDTYVQYNEMVGEEGFPLCHIGDVPMHLIIREYIGYDRGYLELFDHEDEVLSLNEAVTESFREMQEVVLESPGELFLHGMHFDTQMTPPPFYERYIMPYYVDFCSRLESRGKYLAAHEDADASMLLDLLLRSKIHMVDCFASQPLVPCRLEDAVSAWGDSIVIWGGIPSTILCSDLTSKAEFEQYLDLALELSSRSRMILGVSDNVMPETNIGRLEQVSHRLREV